MNLSAQSPSKPRLPFGLRLRLYLALRALRGERGPENGVSQDIWTTSANSDRFSAIPRSERMLGGERGQSTYLDNVGEFRPIFGHTTL
jgi:hypothetical protein